MFGVWQRATGLGILGVVLLPSSRVTLDKSPAMTGLSPWSGGEGWGGLNTAQFPLTPGAGLASWVCPGVEE